MKIGLNMVPVIPELLRDATCKAEELGFESVWIGEHVVVPIHPRTPYPYGAPKFKPDTAFLEPFVALGHLAAATEKIRLGTGICILPIRNPFLTARAITTVDNLSKGRADLGVGTGSIEHEFDLMGADYASRGPRMDEFLDILELLWREETPTYEGKYYRFDAVGFQPKPVQKPGVPVHVGGFSMPALRRAAARGDGWYGGGDSPEQAGDRIRTIDRLRKEFGRDSERFEHTVMVWVPPDRDTIRAYAAAGADRIIVTPFNIPDAEPNPIPKLEDYARYAGLR